MGQGMQVNSFSNNSGDLLARTRPQLPHTLAPITSSTDNIKQSIAVSLPGKRREGERGLKLNITS